jgi:hypothetical protein
MHGTGTVPVPLHKVVMYRYCYRYVLVLVKKGSREIDREIFARPTVPGLFVPVRYRYGIVLFCTGTYRYGLVDCVTMLADPDPGTEN